MSRLIKFLARVGYKQAMTDLVFKGQKEPRANLTPAFVDSNGKRYDRYENYEHLPLALLEQLTILQMEMESRIKGTDLDGWISACEKIANSESRTKVTDIGHMIGVLKDRREVLYDPRLLLEIAALLYIREDEDPFVYSKELHREKFEQFAKDNQHGGLRDFFVQVGLEAYISSSGSSEIELQKSSEQMMESISRFNQLVQKIGASESKSKTT